MQITSRKEIAKNKRTIFEKIKMLSCCAIYLHKAFYLGHLLVSNFFFSPHSRSCCKHFSGKVKSICSNMTVILTMGREGGRRQSSLIFIKNDSAAFFIFSLSAFPKVMRFQQSCSDSSWVERRLHVFESICYRQVWDTFNIVY